MTEDMVGIGRPYGDTVVSDPAESFLGLPRWSKEHFKSGEMYLEMVLTWQTTMWGGGESVQPEVFQDRTLFESVE